MNQTSIYSIYCIYFLPWPNMLWHTSTLHLAIKTRLLIGQKNNASTRQFGSLVLLGYILGEHKIVYRRRVLLAT